MFVANPTDPSFPTIRYLAELGPISSYPRDDRPQAYSARRSVSRAGQRGQLSAIAGIAVGVIAFAAGFAGGFTAASPAPAAALTYDQPMPGEFRLAPGNLTPPGITVPLE
jgi:hypothetical protein